MKKVILAGFASLSCLFAADHNLLPNSYYLFVSHNSFSNASNVQSAYSFDIRFNQNDIQFANFSIDTLQYVLEYTPSVKYVNTNKETGFIKGGANLLWYLDNPSPFTMYLLGGVGLKYVNNPVDPQTLIDAYTNAAVGFEYNIRSDIAVVAEKKFTYEGANKKEYSTSLGFRYSF